MMNIQRIEPIRPLLATESTAVSDAGQTRNQPTMFQDIFQSMVDNVKETDAAKNEAYYALATGQLDNPAVASIAAPTIARSNRRDGRNMPGVSTNINCRLPTIFIARKFVRVV